MSQRPVQLAAYLLAIVLSLMIHKAYAQTTCSTIDVQQGRLEGVCDQYVATFKGIPYAKPPIGELRWKPAEAAERWQGTRSATDFSKSCIQDLSRERLPFSKPFMTQNEVSEHCLTLNIWAPIHRSRGLPVYVYIHGGGNLEGSSSVAVYDGHNFAKHGVVVVSINYRLGYLGFLALPELTAESDRHASGNYAVTDAIAALQWVRANIGAFGGDPQMVTVGGQSAGASMVHDLSASPLAAGLFERAIAESGSALASGPTRTLSDSEAIGQRVMKTLGVTSLTALRALPAEAFLPSRFGNMALRTETRPNVNVDGWVIPMDITETFKQGKQNQAAWITGLQADESSSQKGYGHLSSYEFRSRSEKEYGRLATRFLHLYPADDPRSQKASSQDKGKASMYLWALQSQKHNKLPIYTYYFTEPTPWPDHPGYGAFHTSEIPFDFDNLDLAMHVYTASDRMVSREMTAYWTRFILYGDPNQPGLPKWPATTAYRAETFQFGPVDCAKPLMSLEKLRFWRHYLSSPLYRSSAL